MLSYIIKRVLGVIPVLLVRLDARVRVSCG